MRGERFLASRRFAIRLEGKDQQPRDLFTGGRVDGVGGVQTVRLEQMPGLCLCPSIWRCPILEVNQGSPLRAPL